MVEDAQSSTEAVPGSDTLPAGRSSLQEFFEMTAMLKKEELEVALRQRIAETEEVLHS